MTVKAPKKLIEVALPLDDINIASAREKSIRHGHPSTLHLWWARRPGLESYASDLNPVAVLINKAMIEIPPKFAGSKPVGPMPQGEKQTTLHEEWSGAKGLAEDVRRYGQWMREEAHKRIGHLYPPVEITAEMAQERPDLKPLVGQKLTVIAWLWARTVKSPNPAYAHVAVPLASTFMLST